MASLAVAAVAASASLASPSSSSCGVRPVRQSLASACPLRLRLPLRPARCLPRVLVRASQPPSQEAPTPSQPAPTPSQPAPTATQPASTSSKEPESTFETIKGVIATQLAIEKLESITPESKFTDLGADSLDTVEIMMALEEKFDMQFEQEAGDKIQTVGHAVDLIDSLRTK